MSRRTYTLVRHTGYSVGDNPAFQNAVEERSIDARLVSKVIEMNGRVFDNYADARDEAERYNYPPGATGLVAKAVGSFRRLDAIGEEVFIPN